MQACSSSLSCFRLMRCILSSQRTTGTSHLNLRLDSTTKSPVLPPPAEAVRWRAAVHHRPTATTRSLGHLHFTKSYITSRQSPSEKEWSQCGLWLTRRWSEHTSKRCRYWSNPCCNHSWLCGGKIFPWLKHYITLSYQVEECCALLPTAVWVKVKWTHVSYVLLLSLHLLYYRERSNNGLVYCLHKHWIFSCSPWCLVNALKDYIAAGSKMAKK